jgi:hypothetical protein
MIQVFLPALDEFEYATVVESQPCTHGLQDCLIIFLVLALNMIFNPFTAYCFLTIF